MAISVSLERLVHALANSIIRAQNLVEKAQLANLRSYFDEKHRPINLDLKLPSTLHHGVEDTYRVPLATLVPHGSLVVKKAKVELDVEIGKVDQERYADNKYPDLQEIITGKDTVRPKLMVGPESGGIAKKESGNFAHITLTLGTAENTEGLARLLNELIKGQGRVPEDTNKDEVVISDGNKDNAALSDGEIADSDLMSDE